MMPQPSGTQLQVIAAAKTAYSKMTTMTECIGLVLLSREIPLLLTPCTSTMTLSARGAILLVARTDVQSAVYRNKDSDL